MAVPTTANDPVAACNPPVTKPEGPGRLYRAALLLTHFLHLADCLIVLSIAAYLVAEQHSKTSEKFCIALVSTRELMYTRTRANIVPWAVLGALVFFVALVHALLGFHRSTLPALMLLLSCLWLAASIVAAVEYKDNHCTQVDRYVNFPFVTDCPLRRALIAWSFLAL